MQQRWGGIDNGCLEPAEHFALYRWAKPVENSFLDVVVRHTKVVLVD